MIGSTRVRDQGAPFSGIHVDEYERIADISWKKASNLRHDDLEAKEGSGVAFGFENSGRCVNIRCQELRSSE